MTSGTNCALLLADEFGQEAYKAIMWCFYMVLVKEMLIMT